MDERGGIDPQQANFSYANTGESRPSRLQSLIKDVIGKVETVATKLSRTGEIFIRAGQDVAEVWLESGKENHELALIDFLDELKFGVTDSFRLGDGEPLHGIGGLELALGVARVREYMEKGAEKLKGDRYKNLPETPQSRSLGIYMAIYKAIGFDSDDELRALRPDIIMLDRNQYETAKQLMTNQHRSTGKFDLFAVARSLGLEGSSQSAELE